MKSFESLLGGAVYHIFQGFLAVTQVTQINQDHAGGVSSLSEEVEL